MASRRKKSPSVKIASTKEKLVCGLVMPISASSDEYTEGHWQDVRNILCEAVSATEFEPNLVSDAEEVSIIHKRIVQNLYSNPVVVCDVSSKNPNVMFELGLRLAFDKPTIIVKDDKTDYAFDTGNIEHLEYPRDLRFAQIVTFKENLARKIKETHAKSLTDENYTTFLGHFGKFSVPKLDTQEVSSDTYILEELQQMHKELASLSKSAYQDRSNASSHSLPIRQKYICLRECEEITANDIARQISGMPEYKGQSFFADERSKNHYHITLPPSSLRTREAALKICKRLIPSGRLMPPTN